ncbi:hypothetical protein ARSEF4850_010010 [Beauveria asiatica]
MDTVLMGIYYPGDLRKEAKSKDGLKGMHRLPITGYLACTTLFTKLPAFRNAKLAYFWPDTSPQESGSEGEQLQWNTEMAVVREHMSVSLPEDIDPVEIESSTAKIYTNDDSDKDAGGKKVRGRGKKGVNPYYVVDYILPKDNAQDTSPHNPQGVDRVLRSA